MLFYEPPEQTGLAQEHFLLNIGTKPVYNRLTKQTMKTAVINDVIAVAKDGLLNYRCVIAGNSDTSAIVIKMAQMMAMLQISMGMCIRK